MAGKVVVGYLETERGRDALALGRLLAKARGAELATVTVPAGADLSAAVREEGADLAVLGSTHRGVIGQVVPGTTMARLLEGVHCAVAVAPVGFADRAAGEEDWRPLDGEGEDVGMRVIGVGFDGTRESRAALDYATELALRNGSTLRVYSVVRKAAPVPASAPLTPTQLATTELESRRAELHRAVAELPDEVRALPVLLRGFAADELIGVARYGVDLMVVGTRLGGHLHRLLHRSVAGEIAGTAHCPVLICPTPIGVPLAAACPAA